MNFIWFHVSQNIHLLLIFILQFKHIETILSLWAVPKQKAACRPLVYNITFSKICCLPSFQAYVFPSPALGLVMLSYLLFFEHIMLFVTSFLCLEWLLFLLCILQIPAQRDTPLRLLLRNLSCFIQYLSYNLSLPIIVYVPKHGSYCTEIICAFSFPLTFSFMWTKTFLVSFVFSSLEFCKMPRVWQIL